MILIKNKITFGAIIGIILMISALIILNDTSFSLMGIGLIIIGLCFLFLINHNN